MSHRDTPFVRHVVLAAYSVCCSQRCASTSPPRSRPRINAAGFRTLTTTMPTEGRNNILSTIKRRPPNLFRTKLASTPQACLGLEALSKPCEVLRGACPGSSPGGPQERSLKHTHLGTNFRAPAASFGKLCHVCFKPILAHIGPTLAKVGTIWAPKTGETLANEFCGRRPEFCSPN